MGYKKNLLKVHAPQIYDVHQFFNGRNVYVILKVIRYIPLVMIGSGTKILVSIGFEAFRVVVMNVAIF